MHIDWDYLTQENVTSFTLITSLLIYGILANYESRSFKEFFSTLMLSTSGLMALTNFAAFILSDISLSLALYSLLCFVIVLITKIVSIKRFQKSKNEQLSENCNYDP